MNTLKPSWLALSAMLAALPLQYASADPDCTQLVGESKWSTEKVGGFFAGSYPSLQVTLERNGCAISADETEQILDEIFARHEKDPQWTSPKLTPLQMRDSVRYQLECQLSLSPVPDPITLEPRRQGVSLEAFKKMSSCNTP